MTDREDSPSVILLAGNVNYDVAGLSIAAISLQFFNY